jgi:hypothetical protein
MNRKRWTILAAAAAALVVLIVVALLLNNSRQSGLPSSQRQPFGFDAAYADPDPMVVVVRYGDSGSCPSTAVRHAVVQGPAQIVVTLTRAPMRADRACTSDYGAKLVRVALAAPLAGREVMDGSRKAPVPISTGAPPFG